MHTVPLPAVPPPRAEENWHNNNVLVFKQKLNCIYYIALGYIPGGLTTANQYQMNGTKWQEHIDRHVFDHLRTTGSNRSFASRPEQGILSKVTGINHLLYITTAFLYLCHGNTLRYTVV
jgi:hypothetical protein